MKQTFFGIFATIYEGKKWYQRTQTSHRDRGTCQCFYRNLYLISVRRNRSPILALSHHRPQLSRKVFVPLPDEDPETWVEMLENIELNILVVIFQGQKTGFREVKQGDINDELHEKFLYMWLQGCMLWQDEWEEWCHIGCLFFVAGCAPA